MWKNTFIILLFIFKAHISYSSVWPNEHQWSPEWENQYSKWVETSWDDEIFMRKNSPVYGITTDCADASYTMRILFAYLYRLPFKIHDPHNSGRRYITNDISDFDHISDPQKRFRAFLNYILDITDSSTLANDTYPVAINKNSLKPGMFYVEPAEHTFQIKKISATGIPTLYSSTTPREARYLQISNMYPMYLPSDTFHYRDGYRAFKQPNQFEQPEHTLPNYSLEQYELAKKYGASMLVFSEVLTQKMQEHPETTSEKIDRHMRNLCYTAQFRANLIYDTMAMKAENHRSCLNQSNHEDMSTPNRDKRIKDTLLLIQSVFTSSDFHPEESSFTKYLNDIFTEDHSAHEELKKWCPIRAHDSKNSVISLREVWDAVRKRTLISDANASAAQRWGLEPYQAICPQY